MLAAILDHTDRIHKKWKGERSQLRRYRPHQPHSKGVSPMYTISFGIDADYVLYVTGAPSYCVWMIPGSRMEEG